jgi:hypothetical protein
VLVATCDWSGDGVADAAVANYDGNGWKSFSFFLFLLFLLEGNSISLFINENVNSSTPSFKQQTITPANGPFGIACLDINLDGRQDLVWGNDGSVATGIDDTLSYILNLGLGADGKVMFSAPQTLQIGKVF